MVTPSQLAQERMSCIEEKELFRSYTFTTNIWTLRFPNASINIYINENVGNCRFRLSISTGWEIMRLFLFLHCISLFSSKTSFRRMLSMSLRLHFRNIGHHTFSFFVLWRNISDNFHIDIFSLEKFHSFHLPDYGFLNNWRLLQVFRKTQSFFLLFSFTVGDSQELWYHPLQIIEDYLSFHNF